MVVKVSLKRPGHAHAGVPRWCSSSWSPVEQVSLVGARHGQVREGVHARVEAGARHALGLLERQLGLVEGADLEALLQRLALRRREVGHRRGRRHAEARRCPPRAPCPSADRGRCGTCSSAIDGERLHLHHAPGPPPRPVPRRAARRPARRTRPALSRFTSSTCAPSPAPRLPSRRWPRPFARTQPRYTTLRVGGGRQRRHASTSIFLLFSACEAAEKPCEMRRGSRRRGRPAGGEREVVEDDGDVELGGEEQAGAAAASAGNTPAAQEV